MERARPATGYLRELCIESLGYHGATSWSSFSAALTAGEILSRYFAGDKQTETELQTRLGASPQSPGLIAIICEGWPNTPTFEALRLQLGKATRLPIPLHYKIASIASSADILTDALVWGASELVGDLWEANLYWIPNAIRRIQNDELTYGAMLKRLADSHRPASRPVFLDCSDAPAACQMNLVSVRELIGSLESVSAPLLKSLNRLPFCLPRAIFWGIQCGPRRTAAVMTAAACGMTVT